MSKKLFSRLTLAVFLSAPLPALSQTDLPEGNGKQAVQASCVRCHDLATVTRAGCDQAGWRNNIHTMVNVGASRSRKFQVMR